MGTALSGGDQVDVAFLHRVAAFRQPQQRPIYRFLVARQAAAEWLIGQSFKFADRIHQVGAQAVFVHPLDFLATGFVLETDREPRTQYSLGFQYVLETADRELEGVEIL